ncbi:MAG: potassium channel protein [candidate division WOR-3 bacterium]|nr:MAG: potassium channel protein [candidate division WOR-3 bacterium]
MIHRRVAIIVIAIVAVFLGGTVGYMIIEGWSFNEALYMTIITISTVGYGEVRPLSGGGRAFTATLIISGILLIATGANFIFSSIMEGTFGEIFRRQGMQQKISKMKDHFVICGVGAVGEDIIQEFISANEPFVLIDKEQEVIEAFTREHPKILYITGDATHDDILKYAGIDKAKGIVAALGNDADNLYICLTARSLNPDLRIISRAVEAGSIDKLKKAGADYVFSPEKIGGIHLAAAALRPTVMSFLDTIMRGQHLNLLLDEVTVKTGSPLAGKTLKETEISRKIGIVIPALKSAELNKLTFNPSSDSVINVGDTLIGFGTPEQMTQLRKICS